MFLEKDSFSRSHKLQLGGAAEAIERMTTVSQFSESSFPCFALRDFGSLEGYQSELSARFRTQSKRDSKLGLRAIAAGVRLYSTVAGTVG